MSGIIEGNGHEIKFSITDPENLEAAYIGFINYASGAIKNLDFNIDIDAINANGVRSIAGYSTDGFEAINCNVKGSLKAYQYAGGVCGYLNGSD